MDARLKLMRGIVAVSLAAGGAALVPAVAQAGQVGVTVSIRGSGMTTVVEGSIEDGASGVCDWRSNLNEWVTNSCDRIRNEEAFEAWVWLRPTPGPSPAGHWRFLAWTGCDETREVDGVTECAVHSGAFTGVEKMPTAVFVDDHPPTMNPISESFSTTVERTVTYFFSSNEGGSTFRCRFDSEVSFSPCTSGSPKTYVDEGVHTIEVMGVDPSGQAGSPVSRTVQVLDTDIATGPAQDSRTNSRTAAFTFSSGAGTDYDCSLNFASFTDCAASTTFNDLTERTYTLRVRSKAAGGWFDRIPEVRTWTVDLTPPQTSFEGAPPPLTKSTSATFSFLSNEAGTFRCRLDNGVYHVCPSTKTWSNLSHGTHTLRVWARDDAGNLDPTPALYAWTVDTVKPETTIDSGPTGPTRSTSATFHFSSSEDGTFLCQVDARPLHVCSSPKTWTGLAQGPHTIKVWARDAAGNLDGSAATRSWTVDTVLPNTTITHGPPATTTATSAELRFTSNEAGTFLCQLDARPLHVCSSPRTWTGLTPGSHSVKVWARDLAGNIDGTPATWTWTIAPTRVTRLL